MTTSLQGQVALVTGASGGIGAAVAQTLAAAGAKVGVNYRADPAAAERIVGAIHAAGGDAVALRADVSREAEVQRMFDELHRAYGRIDILVANAGIQRDAAVAQMSLADWNQVLQVNLTGQFLCAQQAIRRFLAQPPAAQSKARGKIICMSSVHQLIPWAGHVNYAASKGGVLLMMQSIAQEVAPQKIRVNGIAPGAIRTGINREAWNTVERERELLKLIPYGRVGEVDDVAQAALWLASDASDYVTGTTLFVDGGMSLYPAFAHGG